MAAAGPIVKWVGGKTKLLPELRARMPKTYGRYFEPFIGGGALFFASAPATATLGDMNVALISMYRTVAAQVDEVVESLAFHRRAHDAPGYYYEIRAAWNEGAFANDPVNAAAVFIYLNKTCFNGLWRVNRNGEFNVPRGKYTSPRIFDAEAMQVASTALSRATLVINDYVTTVAGARRGDFVYFDPPYDPVSDTSNFTSYTKGGFGKTQQEQLAECAHDLKKRGVSVMLSNNDTPFVRELYKDFCIDNVKCARSINSKGDKRGAVDEVIVTSYERTS